MKKSSLGNYLSDDGLNAVGRFSSGLLTTLISQPFDTLARVLQIKRYNNQPLNIRDSVREMQNVYRNQGLRPWEHPLLRGALPRLALAASGGAMAGGLYDIFKKQYIEIA